MLSLLTFVVDTWKSSRQRVWQCSKLCWNCCRMWLHGIARHQRFDHQLSGLSQWHMEHLVKCFHSLYVYQATIVVSNVCPATVNAVPGDMVRQCARLHFAQRTAYLCTSISIRQRLASVWFVTFIWIFDALSNYMYTHYQLGKICKSKNSHYFWQYLLTKVHIPVCKLNYIIIH